LLPAEKEPYPDYHNHAKQEQHSSDRDNEPHVPKHVLILCFAERQRLARNPEYIVSVIGASTFAA
jgi:hypothetical protein